MLVTRESRTNLIFLVILLALSVPGMVLLVGKAWRGEGGLNASPPAAKIKTPYLNPVGTASGVVRVVPPETGDFVESLAQRFLGSSVLRRLGAGGRPRPVMSQGLNLELIGRDDDGLTLLLWLHADGVDASSITLGGVEARVLDVVDVPKAVRTELQKGPLTASGSGFSGYAAPPRQVVVFHVATRDDVDIANITWRRGDREEADIIDLTDLPASTLPDAEPADIR